MAKVFIFFQKANRFGKKVLLKAPPSLPNGEEEIIAN